MTYLGQVLPWGRAVDFGSTIRVGLQGGRRLSALFGLTIHPEGGILKGQHFHIQAEVPVAQSLDGPQLRRRWIVRLGWQVEFGS